MELNEREGFKQMWYISRVLRLLRLARRAFALRLLQPFACLSPLSAKGRILGASDAIEAVSPSGSLGRRRQRWDIASSDPPICNSEGDWQRNHPESPALEIEHLKMAQ